MSSYALLNARIPLGVIAPGDRPAIAPDSEGLVLVHLAIAQGRIASIQAVSATTNSEGQVERFWTAQGLAQFQSANPVEPITHSPQIRSWDLQGGQVWPCFVDSHTHLDKGHIWPRSPNRSGTFSEALTQAGQDSSQYWTAADLYPRMTFGLQCSYAHGTQALRTHLDSAGKQAAISFEVFRELRREWTGRLQLQAVCLVGLEVFLTPEGERLADLVAEIGGVLGGVAWMNPDLDRQLDRTLELARDRQLDLDVHVDESGNPADQSLVAVARAVLRHRSLGPGFSGPGFSGPDFVSRVTCGHCCSLAVQPEPVMGEAIALVREAGIGVVSLPMCNLYLQDRQAGRTPRWRGIAPVQELAAAGVPIAFASDNCRDPFYGFGDHDMLEVFREAVRIGQLDTPYEDWARSVTATPAQLMGLPNLGEVRVGHPADLVLFRGRGMSELLSRPQSDRVVVRHGVAIERRLPDYADLDPVLGRFPG